MRTKSSISPTDPSCSQLARLGRLRIPQGGPVHRRRADLERAGTRQELPDSVDNAQIIRAFPNAAPDAPRAKVLLLSHSPNPGAWSRDRGTISMSCDDGASWTTSKVFHEPFVGYTTIAV